MTNKLEIIAPSFDTALALAHDKLSKLNPNEKKVELTLKSVEMILHKVNAYYYYTFEVYVSHVSTKFGPELSGS